MVSVASPLIEEVTAHAQSDILEDAQEICADGTYFPNNLRICLFLARQPQWARASSFTRFLDHTQRHTTVDRTPLDERPARRTDLYMTTLNTHNRQTSMFPVGFENTISAKERLQTYVSDLTATGIRRYVCFT